MKIKIKLLDLDLIRRYNAIELYVDPNVAKILITKGLALDLTKPTVQVVELKIEKEIIIPKESEDYIFPKSIIQMEE